jgi:hypothetical protein
MYGHDEFVDEFVDHDVLSSPTNMRYMYILPHTSGDGRERWGEVR